MRLRVSKEAEQDLDGIFVYWARRAGVEVADRTIEAIEERFALLCDFPNGGRKCDRLGPGIRSFPTGNYIIYFRKAKRGLDILHIFHGALDQGRAFADVKKKQKT